MTFWIFCVSDKDQQAADLEDLEIGRHDQGQKGRVQGCFATERKMLVGEHYM